MWLKAYTRLEALTTVESLGGKATNSALYYFKRPSLLQRNPGMPVQLIFFALE
jgi:hypothetical protein